MSFAFVGPATSFASTILSYFSPTKSPFYSVIAFGTIALILTCERLEKVNWFWVSLPVFAVLALSAVLSFKYVTVFEPGEGEDQLRFARSFSISSALLTFVITARETQQDSLAFWANYDACLAQIVTFLMYTWVRSESAEEQHKLNFVQFALITATFLIGASYANAQYASRVTEKLAQPSTERYLVVAVSLYGLWLCLLLLWIKHLAGLIEITIPGAAPPSRASRNSDDG